jgi:hypothetical protein
MRAARLALAAWGVAFCAGGAEAASSKFCQGGGFVLTQQGDTLRVRGRHVGFDVDQRTMAVRNWTPTGARTSAGWSTTRR